MIGTHLYLGQYAGSDGTYTLSGTGILSSAKDQYLGLAGTGELNQTGGSNTAGRDLYLGFYSGSSGTYTIDSGQLSSVANQYIGSSGTGTLTQTAGTNAVGKDLYLGRYSGSNGTYEISGSGQLLPTGNEYVGTYGTGLFTQTGGTNNVGRELLIGFYSGSNGTYTLSGTGQMSSLTNQSVGCTGTGTLTQTGGTNTVGSNLYLGRYSGSTGSYNLSGTAQVTSTNGQYVGCKGTGTFTQTGGTNTVGSALTLAHYPNSTGSYLFGDATSTGTLTEDTLSKMIVRNDIATNASALFRGWGTVAMSGELRNNGRVLADGYGTERDLNLAQFTSVTNDDSLGVVQGDGTLAGWYAQDDGRLILPSVTVGTGNATYVWGETAGDTTIDLVNSALMSLTSVTVGGDLDIDLLATDRSDVPAIGSGSLIGVWDFSTPGGFDFASADLTFRYDNVLAASLGITEADLLIYQYTGGSWSDITTSIDVPNHRISADGVTSLSLFAVGAGLPVAMFSAAAINGPGMQVTTVPEPGMLALLAIGLIVLLACRRKPSV